MTSTLAQYLSISNNMSRWLTLTQNAPANATATKYFEQNIGSVTNASELINNPRLFNYAMNAFGLGDMTYAKGLMQKVLAEGVTSSSALANTLDNPNILAFAKAFDFADNGSQTTTSSTLVNEVVNRYAENSLDTTQGQQDPGVQLALYFQQNAPNISSVYSILADKNLLTVVQTALGISPLTADEPIDTQAAMLTSALNISDFQNPTKLQSFIERFAALYDANNGSSSTTTSNSTSSSSIVSLFQSSSSVSTGVININPTTLYDLTAGGSSGL